MNLRFAAAAAAVEKRVLRRKENKSGAHSRKRVCVKTRHNNLGSLLY